MKIYLDEKIVSQMTGRALSSLRNDRFKRKNIPYVKFGRSCRYCEEDVINFMEKRKVQTEEI